MKSSDLDDVRLVLAVSLIAPPGGPLAVQAHKDFLAVRRRFLDTGQVGAWDRCVMRARRLNDELARRSPPKSESEVEAMGRGAAERGKAIKRRTPPHAKGVGFDPLRRKP
jgi:hypothetical protein